MTQRITVPEIRARKGGEKLVVLTCYTAPMARILDPHVDILLVGDSLGMVLYGMENTRNVPLDTMIAHGKAVAGHSSHALVVIDLPAGSYENSPQQALTTAKRVLSETGAQMVKFEGGKDMAPTIAHLVKNNVPVMAHVGLLPQRVKERSGFRIQGRTPDDATRILEDARAVEGAGATCVVIEAVAEAAARDISGKLGIPTIGIGASPACDGQVLVTDDMLGLSGGYVPGFVKPYAQLAPLIEQAVKSYASEVKSGAFPSPEYCFPYKKR